MESASFLLADTKSLQRLRAQLDGTIARMQDALPSTDEVEEEVLSMKDFTESDGDDSLSQEDKMRSMIEKKDEQLLRLERENKRLDSELQKLDTQHHLASTDAGIEYSFV